jgi:hypothetical protein
MMKTTTQIDLLNYAYNETDLLDSDRIQRTIDGDPVIAENFKEVVNVLGILDSAQPPIDPASIEKILQFC